MIFVEPMLNVVTREDVPPVTVCQDIKEIPIQGVSEEIVFPIQNAGTIKPVKITNVLILVEHPVALALTVRSIIMWLFADVLEDLQEILSRAAEDLLRMKSVKLVGRTLIVRLDKMTDQSADAKQITLVTHYKDAVVSVIQTVIVLKPKNVYNSNVWLPAERELVVITPIVWLEITVPIVPAHLISWEMLEPDVTLSVPDMMNAQTAKPVSNSSVRTHAENLIQMYAVVAPTVK